MIGQGSRVAHVIMNVPPPRQEEVPMRYYEERTSLASRPLMSVSPFRPLSHPSIRPSVRPRPASQREKREKGERETECEREEHKERRTSRFICQTPHLFRIQDYKFSFSPLLSLSLSPSIHPSGGIAKFPRGEIFSTIAVHRPNGQREGGGEEVDWASRGEGRGVRCPDNSVMGWG